MTSKQQHDDKKKHEAPSARVKKRRWTIFWLIPIFAAGVAAWLVYREFVHTGYDIEIRFQDVSGLVAGKSQIKFRGVAVGHVRELKLEPERNSAIVEATLGHEYQDLAREGTQFWVVRPQISGTQIKGLAALVSQDFINLQVGQGKSEKTKFVGAEHAPVTEEEYEPPKGLHVRLLAPRRWGLQRGSRIYFRDVEAGSVVSYDVTPDASAVTFDAVVQKRFAPLIHADTRFWKVSGIDFSAGLFSGVNVKMENLQALMAGGIEFATPPGTNAMVEPGFIFPIQAEAQDEWKQWRPSSHLASASSEKRSGQKGEKSASSSGQKQP